MLAARSVYQCLCVPYVLCWRFCCLVCLPGQKLYYKFFEYASVTNYNSLSNSYVISPLKRTLHSGIAHCFADSNRTNDDHQQQNLKAKCLRPLNTKRTVPSIQSRINSKQIKVKLIKFRFKLLFLSPFRAEFYSGIVILLKWWI